MTTTSLRSSRWRSPASFAGVGNPHAISSDRSRRGRARHRMRRGDGFAPCCQAHWTSRPRDRRRHDGCDARASDCRCAASLGLTNVDVRDGDATRLPVDDSTVDVVISNGVLNLVPDKTSRGPRDRASAEARWTRADRGHRHWRSPSRQRASRHRSLDRLNRRCSAGSRARRRVRVSRLHERTRS